MLPSLVPQSIQEAAELLATEPSPYAVERRVMAGVDLLVFKHAPSTLPALYAASARHAAREFLIYDDERLSFAETAARAANLAHRLVHEFGVMHGDRVVLAMRNLPEWALAYMAITSIGAIVVPLNAWWTGAELRYGVEDSGAQLAIVDSERLGRLEPVLGSLATRLIVARPVAPLPANAHALAPLLEGAHGWPVVTVLPEDYATILYTSGSTGQAKGVVSTHRATASAVMTWEALGVARLLTELPAPIMATVRQWLALGAEALKRPPFDMPQRSMLVTLPLFHVTGCNVQFLPAFRSGRKLVMMRRWNPELALELIERERITDFSGVPTMSWELVHSPDFDKRDTSTLATLSAGGASRPPAQVQQLKDKAQHTQPSAGYGMTETNSLGAGISGDEYLARPASVGRALPPLVELKIVDAAGHTLGVDQEGEICIKSASNMRGYWHRPEDTEASLVDGYLVTGDLGRIDAEGFLFITGRAKDIVIRGGENISCSEVENALHEHPAVFEAAVYGVADERLGEAVAASIRVRAGHEVTEDALSAHVRQRLAQFKVPEHWSFQPDPLPRLGSGKVDKLVLRQEAERRLKRG